MRMRYATTNRTTTNPGNDWRTVLPLREAPVSSTALGKGDCPGWWMQQTDTYYIATCMSPVMYENLTM